MKFPPDTMDTFKNLEPEERMMRTLFLPSCGINIIKGMKAHKSGAITKEQLDELIRVCIALYDAQGADIKTYDDAIKEATNMVVSLNLADEEIAKAFGIEDKLTDRSKMN